MWNLKQCGINGFIYKTEIDLQTQKINLWLQKGKGGRINQEFRINQTYSAIYKIDKQSPTVQHREIYSTSCNNL